MKPMIGMLWTWTCQITIVIITFLPVGDPCLIFFRQFSFCISNLDSSVGLCTLDLANASQHCVWNFNVGLCSSLAPVFFLPFFKNGALAPCKMMACCLTFACVARSFRRPQELGALNLDDENKEEEEEDSFWAWWLHLQHFRQLLQSNWHARCLYTVQWAGVSLKNICVHTLSFCWTFPLIWFLHHCWLATMVWCVVGQCEMVWYQCVNRHWIATAMHPYSLQSFQKPQGFSLK